MSDPAKAPDQSNCCQPGHRDVAPRLYREIEGFIDSLPQVVSVEPRDVRWGASLLSAGVRFRF